MGKYIYPEEIKVVKLETPIECTLKDKNNNPITFVLNYEVTIKFSGISFIGRVTDMDAVLKKIENHREYYSPDTNDVTMNGRFTCD